MRRSLRILVSVALLLAGGCCCGARTGLRVPDLERLAFDRVMPGTGTDVWLMDVGRTPTRLTTHAQPDMYPAFSRDGLTVAFSTERNMPMPAVFTISVSGGAESFLFSGARENQNILDLRWSADGRRMAYVLDDGVWLRDVAAGTNRRLTPVGVHASWPSFGPDGIYFSRVTGTGARQIWRIDPSSGSLTRLLGTPDGSDQPAWTTDGSAMFYVYEGNIERIARNSTRGTIIVTNGSQPAPSPSRGRLAFVRGGAIWTSTFDGAAQVAASTGPQDQHPVWSPPIRQ